MTITHMKNKFSFFFLALKRVNAGIT